jgi:hypothetical protein
MGSSPLGSAKNTNKIRMMVLQHSRNHPLRQRWSKIGRHEPPSSQDRPVGNIAPASISVAMHSHCYVAWYPRQACADPRRCVTSATLRQSKTLHYRARHQLRTHPDCAGAGRRHGYTRLARSALAPRTAPTSIALTCRWRSRPQLTSEPMHCNIMATHLICEHKQKDRLAADRSRLLESGPHTTSFTAPTVIGQTRRSATISSTCHFASWKMMPTVWR